MDAGGPLREHAEQLATRSEELEKLIQRTERRSPKTKNGDLHRCESQRKAARVAGLHT